MDASANSRAWGDAVVRWGSAASGDAAATNEGFVAQMPVFLVTDPRIDVPLSREVSWMVIDAFAALQAAHPSGPRIEHVRNLWRDITRGISRRVAEATILRSSPLDSVEDMRIAGLVAARVEDEAAWIALASGGMEIVSASDEGELSLLPQADDIGYDIPGNLWKVPMEVGQRFIIATQAVRENLMSGLHEFKRAERAASTIIARSSRVASSAQAAIVVDVLSERTANSLASPPTLMAEIDVDDGPDIPDSQVPGSHGLQALGIDYASRTSAPRRSHFAPPKLDDFHFISYLGSGGFSDVYLYEEQLPKRLVAIKVLSKAAKGAGAVSQFRDEVDLMAQLSSHPSVVTIHDANVSDSGQPYVVMQYCPMPSLAERLANGPLPVAEALRMGIQVAGAVHTAHVMGILHYDLKPANVLYSEFGRPVLGDFGIATLLNASNQDVVGASLPWAAPEVLANRPSGQAADVYSLAATVYTAVAGRAPYASDEQFTRREYIERVLASDVPTLPGSDGPSDDAGFELLVDVLRKGMAHDPADRHASAAELGRALQSVQLAAGQQPTDLEIPH
ncbi:MAG: serine/threonine-protein kinase [Actinomycetaceae bacterium]|nr:serine/threonine-protein kinase [Actinomycetaceae bacterium]